VLAVTGCEVLKAHKAKTACMEHLFNMKNFVLRRYPSLTVQWVITWSMKSEGDGIGPVKPAGMTFSDDESFLPRFC